MITQNIFYQWLPSLQNYVIPCGTLLSADIGRLPMYQYRHLHCPITFTDYIAERDAWVHLSLFNSQWSLLFLCTDITMCCNQNFVLPHIDINIFLKKSSISRALVHVTFLPTNHNTMNPQKPEKLLWLQSSPLTGQVAFLLRTLCCA